MPADAATMIAQASASSVLKVLPVVPTTTAVEYYWAKKDHYFYAVDPAEIAALDALGGKPWARTGESFKVFVSGSSGGQGTAVCRYYGLPGAGYGAATVLRDKEVLRKVSAAAGIANPESVPVSGPAEVAALMARWGRPVVLKPANRQASLGTQRGITILNQRVRRAAARLCDRRSVRPLGDYLAQQDCVAGTMQTARPQIEQALAVDRHARLAARQQRPADTN